MQAARSLANAGGDGDGSGHQSQRDGRTDAGGHYLFSQVNPGTIPVTVRLSGLCRRGVGADAGGRGTHVALNFTLQVNSTSQTVEVTAQQGLLSLDNPNTTTTLEAKTIKSLPNPGQDLTMSRNSRRAR
jgi:hypothetical protein